MNATNEQGLPVEILFRGCVAIPSQPNFERHSDPFKTRRGAEGWLNRQRKELKDVPARYTISKVAAIQQGFGGVTYQAVPEAPVEYAAKSEQPVDSTRAFYTQKFSEVEKLAKLGARVLEILRFQDSWIHAEQAWPERDIREAIGSLRFTAHSLGLLNEEAPRG